MTSHCSWTTGLFFNVDCRSRWRCFCRHMSGKLPIAPSHTGGSLGDLCFFVTAKRKPPR